MHEFKDNAVYKYKVIDGAGFIYKTDDYEVRDGIIYFKHLNKKEMMVSQFNISKGDR